MSSDEHQDELSLLPSYHDDTVSGMAEWLRHSLAEWKVPGSNLTMGNVSEKVSVKKKKFRKKKKKKPASYPSACMMEVRMTGVLPNS